MGQTSYFYRLAMQISVTLFMLAHVYNTFIVYDQMSTGLVCTKYTPDWIIIHHCLARPLDSIRLSDTAALWQVCMLACKSAH